MDTVCKLVRAEVRPGPSLLGDRLQVVSHRAPLSAPMAMGTFARQRKVSRLEQFRFWPLREAEMAPGIFLKIEKNALQTVAECKSKNAPKSGLWYRAS